MKWWDSTFEWVWVYFLHEIDLNECNQTNEINCLQDGHHLPPLTSMPLGIYYHRFWDCHIICFGQWDHIKCDTARNLRVFAHRAYPLLYSWNAITKCNWSSSRKPWHTYEVTEDQKPLTDSIPKYSYMNELGKSSRGTAKLNSDQIPKPRIISY